MAKVLKGDEADEVLIDKVGITQNELDAMGVKLGEALDGITNNSCAMVNILVRALAAVVSHIERCGDEEIEGVTINILKAHIERIRYGNKKEAN